MVTLPEPLSHPRLHKRSFEECLLTIVKELLTRVNYYYYYYYILL